MAIWPANVSAHAIGTELATRPGSAWTLDPLPPGLLGLALLIYLLGLRRYWRRAGFGRGVGVGRAAAHSGGLLTLFLALVWPLDVLGGWSLAAHMAQHMLLVAVAPPLLMLGRPSVIWLAAAPLDWRGSLTRTSRAVHRILPRHLVAMFRRPAVALLLQAAVMWGWHAPAAMQLALTSDAVHYAMHASFFGVGLLFWWTMLLSLREQRAGFGAGVIAMLGTMLQMGLLSALLTFSPRPHYAFYFDRVAAVGLTPLEDQQLAGLIMWVPGAVPYLVGGLALMAAWLRRSERHARRLAGP